MKIVDTFLYGRAGDINLSDGVRTIRTNFFIDENIVYNKEFIRLGRKSLKVTIKMPEGENFYALIRYDGTLISDKVYRDFDYFDTKENLAPVCEEHKWGFINMNGEEIIPCQYEYPYQWYEDYSPYYFSDGRIVLHKEDTLSCEIRDSKGCIIVPFDRYDCGCGTRYVYDRLKVKRFNMAPSQYGFVNNEGIEVIPMIHSDVSDFFMLNGCPRAIVAIADSRTTRPEWFLIDQYGHNLAGPFQGFYPPEDDRIAAITFSGQITFCQ